MKNKINLFGVAILAVSITAISCSKSTHEHDLMQPPVQQQNLSFSQKQAAQRHQIVMETQNKAREMANETYMNKLKTSDKHQKAVLDYIKQ